MSLPTGVAKRGSNYHLQIKVPVKLRPIIKRPFWIRTSLHCADKPTAAALAHRHWAEATAAFAAAEAKLRPRESVPLSSALATYILKEAERLPLALDEVLRFEPGALVAWLRSIEAPRVRFLTSEGDSPLPEPDYLRPSPDGSLTHAQVERLRYITQLSIDDFGKQMSMGRLKVAQDFAEERCASLGVLVDWTASSHRSFLVDVLRTMLMGWISALERGQGKPVATPPMPESPLAAPVVPRSKKPKTLTDVFDEWKVGKKRDAVNKMTRALNCVETAGIKLQLAGLTRQDGLAFRDHINATMHKASGKTRSDVLANIQALLNFARKEKGWLDVNPWAGTAIAKGRAKKRDTWSESELRVLLAAPPAQDRRLDTAAQYWIPLLALLTGARQAELCQLLVSDVRERDGVWLLDINEDGNDKSVKSAAGIRRVAVHSKLIELGFIDYVNGLRGAGQAQVFPGILSNPSRTPALYVSDWFRYRCKSLGVYRRWRDFHALRTTVGTALRAVDPPHGEANILAVMGHDGDNVGIAHYHHPAITTIQKVVESLQFAALEVVRPFSAVNAG